MKRIAQSVLLLMTAFFLPAYAAAAEPDGAAEIRGPLLDSEIVIRTTERLAGAIDSVTWRGQEFIDSADHGRQLQSASNFDAGGPFIAETFNPTEAGSVADGAGPTSTSQLLHLLAGKNRLQTTNQMAFWLPPDGKSQGNPARNKTALSNHLLTKRVTIGYRDLPQVIQYDVTFGLPIDESHSYAQFEVVTGYMPEKFTKFLGYDAKTDSFIELDRGPGEQKLPIVLATADGKFAMGCFTPDRAGTDRLGAGWSGPGYGRFEFKWAHVTKWNCVFRLRNNNGVPPGDYSFRTFVVMGNLPLVREGLRELTTEFADE